jgi:hypothetical protein
MTTNPDNEQIPSVEIPQSAELALEYLIWLLERAGVKFRSGKTALYWNLIHVVMNHISK